jgi:hypothetical protein
MCILRIWQCIDYLLDYLHLTGDQSLYGLGTRHRIAKMSRSVGQKLLPGMLNRRGLEKPYPMVIECSPCTKKHAATTQNIRQNIKIQDGGALA